MFAPNAGYEITGTGRYAALGTKVQACVSATRDWKAGEEIRFCTGVIACLTSEQEELMSKENRDFSIMYSTRKSSPCLFLGPARFMNHDCGSNCRFMPYGENGITFKVVKDIACGEEITTFYGAHYFGEDNCECWCATCEVEGRGHFAAEPRGPIVLKATTNASSRRRSSRKRKQQSYEEFFAKVKRRRKLQSYEDADSVAEESLPARNSKKENLPTSGDVDTHAQQRPSCGTTYHHGALPNYASLHGPPPPVAYHNANLEPYEHQPISFDSNVNLPSGVCSASNAPYGYQRMPQAYTDEPHNMLWNMEDFQYEYPVKMRQYHKAHPRSLFCHMCSPSEQRRQLYATQLQQNCTYSAAYVNCDNNVSSLSDRTNPSAYPYRSFMDMLDPNQPPYLEERMSSNLSHASFNPSPEFYATVHNPYDAYYELPGPAVNSGFMNSAVSSVTIGANHTLASLSPSAFSLSPHTMSETTTYALSSDSEDNGSCHALSTALDSISARMACASHQKEAR
ncbi:hypothetical protein BCR43DRAFT_78830 [Syncephalastrum racemosum]|uniref:SET domain-containing protein n=1 Tax=Syncephalastrum racemosum TaxID=13706 RepID=A0A1X2H3U2_SYNRA|nr:hypothetical protein BCR43DRAFT_78830 [Syncephalastrum racemosum]